MIRTTVADEVKSGNSVTYFTVGVSMRPLLIERRTHVTIVPLEKAENGDILLYVRKDGSQVLHRCIKQDENFYYMRGDNTFGLEPIEREQAVGVVTHIFRKGKRFNVKESRSYRAYVILWRLLYPARLAFFKIRSALREIKMTEQSAKKILSLVMALLFVAFVAGVSLWETGRDTAYKDAHYEYQGRTIGYQVARDTLREELAELNKEPIYYGDKANIMVGFAVTSADDIGYILERSDTYGFTPVIIVDSSQPVSNIMSIVETADAEWEIMLFSQILSSSTGNKLASIKAEIEANGKSVCDAVFTRVQSISASDITMLQNAGFSGFTLYHNQPVSGQSENGAVFFDFSRITDGNKLIQNRLSVCYEQKSSMIYFFDMNSLRSGSISDKELDTYLSTIAEFVKKDGCSYATVSETVEMLSNVNQTKADIKASRAAQIASLEMRIAALDQIISDIYIDCFGEQ